MLLPDISNPSVLTEVYFSTGSLIKPAVEK